jgi:tetratricopeptide (TPR) repeat protein
MNNWQDAEQFADRASEMYEHGKWADAELALRQALEIDPDQGDWHFNLGLTLERVRRDAEALSSFEQASRLLEDAIDPQLAAGAACLRLGRFTDAVVWLDRVLKLNPKIELAWAMLVDAHASNENHDSAETAFYMAQDALDEQGAPVLVAMSGSLLTRGLVDRAVWCANEALKKDPDVQGGRLRLAGGLVATGQNQRASQILLQELREDPGNIQALLLHSDVLAESSRSNEAMICLHRVLELEPANIDAHIRAGQFAMSEGRFEEAFIAWGLVRRLHPSHPIAGLRIAQTLLSMHRPAAARPHLHEYLDSMQDSSMPDPAPEEWLHVAELFLASGEPEVCATQLQQLLSTLEDGNPLKVKSLRLLAVALFTNDKIDNGASVSRKVLRLEPTCIASMHNLALASMKNNRFRSAWGWVRRGLRQDPLDNDLRRLRSRLIWESIGTFCTQLSKRIVGKPK